MWAGHPDGLILDGLGNQKKLVPPGKLRPILCTMRSSYINKGLSIKKILEEFVLLPLVFFQNVELGILFFDD